jgi:hypothetical protein
MPYSGLKTTIPKGKRVMKYTMKKLASSALICAAAVLAAPAAQADFVTFETFSNNVSATLGAKDTTYNGGQSFNTSGLTLTMSDSAFAQSLGMNGLAGAIIDGTNPFNCALLSCPSDNLTKYFGGLNDGAVTIMREGGAGFFSLSSLSFAFIAPLDGLMDVTAGQLQLTALLTDGSSVSVARDFAGQGADGKFQFDQWVLAPEFSLLHVSSLRIDACVFDASNTCINSLANPAMNQAQFALDDLAISVPLPGTVPLMLLGMAGLAWSRRRAQ